MRGRGQSGRVLLAWREGSVQVGGGGWKGWERGGQLCALSSFGTLEAGGADCQRSGSACAARPFCRARPHPKG